MVLALQMARIPSSFMARLSKDLLRIKGSDVFIDIFLIYPMLYYLVCSREEGFGLLLCMPSLSSPVT